MLIPQVSCYSTEDIPLSRIQLFTCARSSSSSCNPCKHEESKITPLARIGASATLPRILPQQFKLPVLEKENIPVE